MRAVAVGKYNGRTVEVTWSDEDIMDGPQDVLVALIKKGSEMTGQEIGNPEVETITYDYLSKYFGFCFVAGEVFDSSGFGGVRFEWPDGEPEGYEESEDGTQR